MNNYPKTKWRLDNIMKDSILSICNKQKFDFVGNIHDYFGQLIELPGELGYDVNPSTYNIITAPK